MKALGMVQMHWSMQKRLTNAKTSVSLRLNEFLSKNDVNALKRVISRKKRVLCTLSCLTQWKHWEWCKCIELYRNRLTNAKTSVSLRLNKFLSKNDVNELKRVISR